jgi:hypothetical protein
LWFHVFFQEFSMRSNSILQVLLLGLLFGCNQSPPGAPPSPPPAASPPAPTAPAEDSLPPPPTPVTPTTQVAPQAPPQRPGEPVAPTPGPGMVLEKAGVGSGAKGRNYGEGILATPASVYWSARERIMFTIQIPELLRAYKFEHDFKGPKSDQEFQKEVIKKYHITLPTLPPGHRYVYDPTTEQLMVEKPQGE